MRHALIIVSIGTVALSSISAMLYTIARAHHAYGRYGREALAVAASLLGSYIPTRLLLYTHHISAELALQINSITAIVAAVLLAELVYMRRVERLRNGGAPSTTKGAP